MHINDLGKFRYSITGIANDVFPSLIPMAQVSPTLTMATTYAQLVHAHLARLQSETTSTQGPQIARNHMTALRGFLRSLGKTETSPIGDEMTGEHAASVKRYLAQMDIGERSKCDRRSLLNSWRMTFDLMGAAPEVCVRGRERRRADIPSPTPTPFELGLKVALRQTGLAPKQAARLAGVSTSAVGRWTRGALPNLRSTTTLDKLEAVLQLPAGRLSELLRETLDKSAPLHRSDYRERLKARCEDVYLLKVSGLSDRFLTDWNNLLKHKTAIRTTNKKRYAGGRWSMTSSATSKSAIPGISTLNDRHFATASIYWGHVSAYLGFLQRPVEKDGWGATKDAVQSLAWLVIPEALDAYLTFQTERSGGLRHKGHVVFCNSVAALTHPEHGYLLQSPELLEQLPEDTVAGRSWAELCGMARRTVAEWKSACSDVSRDPVQPIQLLLDKANPMEPMFDAMRRLRDIGNAAPTGSLEEAVARRDELLLGLLLSNPLRRKNLIELTVRPDNSGTVYLSNTNEWRIRLQRATFKNGKKGTQESRAYDVKVALWLNELLTDYVRHFRPLLAVAARNDNLFLSRGGTPMNDMTHRVLVLTRTLIPGSGGFGPHAIRHLVASDWLRRNPGDFLTVAELLNDTLEVVLSTYAHLKQDDALTRHSNQLNQMLPDYLRKK
jgi:integrase/transcriptional regulator with XRE-family HTH domain